MRKGSVRLNGNPRAVTALFDWHTRQAPREIGTCVTMPTIRPATGNDSIALATASSVPASRVLRLGDGTFIASGRLLGGVACDGADVPLVRAPIVDRHATPVQAARVP